MRTPDFWLPGLCHLGHSFAVLAKSLRLLGLSYCIYKMTSRAPTSFDILCCLSIFKLEPSLVSILTVASLTLASRSRIWAVGLGCLDSNPAPPH